MRCPYCGSFNRDNTAFCFRCGRNLSSQTPPPPPPSPPGSRQPQPQRPATTQPRPPQPVTPMQAPPSARPVPQQTATRVRSAPPVAPPPVVAPPEPEPPVAFPPRTMAQLHALETGAQTYTLVSDTIGNGRKRIVRITYRSCPAWMQVATLLKALKEYQSDQFETIIIQGVREQDMSPYAYTNGQLVFDRNTRLGSQVLNRYQIETGDGMASDSVRVVLSE